MSRLTKQLREKMLETVLEHAFTAKQQAANRAKVAAGEKVYTDIYGAHLIAMESLPKGFMNKGRYIYIAIAGQKHCVELSEQKKIGYSHDSRHSETAKLYVGDEVIAQEFLAAVDVSADLDKQRKAMHREVYAVLESVHTFKKLWEVWPECKSLLEKFEDKPTIAILPAVQVHRLNAALGLPAETQEQDA